MATEQYYIWYEMVMVQIHTERNGYGAKYIWYEMVSGYGTKWLASSEIQLTSMKLKPFYRSGLFLYIFSGFFLGIFKA